MQKKKNESGITLIATVVTIIVMLLLAGISVYTGLSSVSESKSQKEQAELEIIQQAVVGQYAKASRLGFLLISPSDESEEVKPNIWKGTMIEQIDDIGVNSITSNIDWISDSFVYYEDYYYRLSSSDLMELGIRNSQDTFVVNYKTGEVYNETKKVTDFDEPLYIKSINNTTITESEPEIDTTFSNDED